MDPYCNEPLYVQRWEADIVAYLFMTAPLCLVSQWSTIGARSLSPTSYNDALSVHMPPWLVMFSRPWHYLAEKLEPSGRSGGRSLSRPWHYLAEKLEPRSEENTAALQ